MAEDYAAFRARRAAELAADPNSKPSSPTQTRYASPESSESPSHGPMRAVAEPAAKVDTQTGKHVLNLDRAASEENDVQQSRKALQGQVVKPQVDEASEKAWTKRENHGVKHLKENFYTKKVTGGGVDAEGKTKKTRTTFHHPETGQQVTENDMRDAVSQHMLNNGSSHPGLQAWSDPGASPAPAKKPVEQRGLQVSPEVRERNNQGGRGGPAGAGGPSVSTGNEDKTPVPSTYKGKKSGSKVTKAAVSPVAEEPAKAKVSADSPRADSPTARQGRRETKANAYEENHAEGQSQRAYYASNNPSSNVTGSKAAQGVMHDVRQSSPINHGNLGKAAAGITSAVHAGLSRIPSQELPAADEPKVEAPAHPSAVSDSKQFSQVASAPAAESGTPGKLTMLTKPGTKGVTPPHMVSSAPDRMHLSPQKANKAKKEMAARQEAQAPAIEAPADKATETAAPAETPKPKFEAKGGGGGIRQAGQAAVKTQADVKPVASSAPEAKTEAVKEAPKVAESGTSTPPVTSPKPEVQVKAGRSSSPVAPTPPAEEAKAAPGRSSRSAGTGKLPDAGHQSASRRAASGMPTQAAQSAGSGFVSSPAYQATASSAPVSSPGPQRQRRSSAAQAGNVPTATAAGQQFGGEGVVHNHYYGNVNQGTGTQVNGNNNTVATDNAAIGSSTGGGGGGAGRGAGQVSKNITVGQPTKTQRALYSAIHTSVNGHSIAGAVNHVTGGGHLGMEDHEGNPIGKPTDKFVQNHPVNGGTEKVHSGSPAGRAARQQASQDNMNQSQFAKARASRQNVAPTE